MRRNSAGLLPLPSLGYGKSEKGKPTSVSRSYLLCDLECVPTFPGCHEGDTEQQASVPSSALGAQQSFGKERQ